MKRILLYIAFLSLFFSSCTIEDEFTELTSHDDFLIQTTVFLKDPAESYRIKFVYYKTDGYNNLTEKFISQSGSSNDDRETFYGAVKEYKKVGLKIDPVENIDYIAISFLEVGYFMEPYFQHQQKVTGAFTLMYDFETNTHEIIQN